VPKKFQRNALELLSEPPKSGVCLRYILPSSKIVEDPKLNQKTVIIEFPTQFTIKFRKSKGNPLNDGNFKSLIKKPYSNSKKNISIWIFTLKN
jgi:hypothetical protein